MVDDVIQDARYGFRLLRRTPVVTAVAIITLTVAIGANTAGFSILNVLMLRGLAVRDPGSLVQFSWQYPGDPPLNMFSLGNLEHYRSHTTAFSDLAGVVVLAPD